MIIYVTPRGEAHTIDQAHKAALFYEAYKKTFIGAMAEVGEAMRVIWDSLKPIFEKAIEKATSFLCAVNSTSNARRKHEKRHVGGLREWLKGAKIIKTRVCRSKGKLKSQTKNIDVRMWQTFKKSRHRGR